MKLNSTIVLSAGRKWLIVLLMGCITDGAFATLGEGKAGNGQAHKLLSTRTPLKPGAFSLRSGYNFRGNQVINFESNRYIDLNSTVTYQQGHTSYTIPVRKKVILNNRITFNPNAATR